MQAFLARLFLAVACFAPLSAAAQQPGSYRDAVQAYLAAERDIAQAQATANAGRLRPYDYLNQWESDRAKMAALKRQWGDRIVADAAKADPALAPSITPDHLHFPAKYSDAYQSRQLRMADVIGKVIAAVIGAGLLFGLWKLLPKLFRDKAEEPPSDVYGTASYAPIRYVMPSAAYHHRGVFLGKSSDPDADDVPTVEHPGAPVCSRPEHHVLIVAPTRTGKGTRILVPTLLSYHGSVLAIDPKGENAAITARARAALPGLPDAEVFIVNPWDELADTFNGLGFQPAAYNPLDVIERDDPNAVAVAQALAATVCPATSEKDRFWQGSAANILAAVFLWITDQPGEVKTLARAREIVSLSHKDFTERFLVPMAASSAFGGAIREMVSQYLDLAHETYSGIMSNLTEATKFISDPQLKAATSESSFDMRQLAAYPTTVYLIIPPDRMDTQRTWLRLMVTAATHTFKRAKAEHRGVHRTLFLIDEFPALGRMPDMPRDIATMAGYGVDYALAVQGIDQLKDVYKDAAGAILGNCAYKWYCNVSDLESAKYLSDTLGQKTVKTKSTSMGTDGKESESVGETGRPLLMPDEIMTLGRDVALVTNPEGRPFYLRPVDYWQLHDAFKWTRKHRPKELGEVFLHLTYDPNPYRRA
ncbi:type IV secretory system conjugative DNA transfer family protein [Rhodopila sp.]|uniref:type IV secretory system conjugative DNA transfer family protein n=1 Tax=Rhodopila sp. TaxID=2480087 RepID=UPI002CF14F30|nr:type IV secretory system conjugative DNA transfer family protein [Rhodopila sp.]HVZ10139.1 type IV secretory system conjugative DNA transfer family protein [Rhodopila sp.]